MGTLSRADIQSPFLYGKRWSGQVFKCSLTCHLELLIPRNRCEQHLVSYFLHFSFQGIYCIFPRRKHHFQSIISRSKWVFIHQVPEFSDNKEDPQWLTKIKNHPKRGRQWGVITCTVCSILSKIHWNTYKLYNKCSTNLSYCYYSCYSLIHKVAFCI